MFAYYFPPDNAVGGMRPYRFYKYLSQMGYRCHVITASDQSARPDSDSDYVQDPFVAKPRHGYGWQVERGIRKFLLPGATGIRWSRRACQAARAFLNAHPNTEVTIFSTYPPLGAHLAALQFVRQGGHQWIADFRDPLRENPSHTFLNSYQENLHSQLERIISETAEVIIANTDTMAERLKKYYPHLNDRIHLIWNGFDPEDRIEPLPLPQRGYRMVSHVGALYQGRNITPLLQSLLRLFEKGRLGAIRIRLVGSVLAESVPTPDFLQRAVEAGWLELIPREVPQNEARTIAQTSDGLLLVQPHSTVQVPSKLYEYLQIGRPILAYVPFNTPIERILKQSNVPYRCVYAGSSPEKMDDAVESFFKLGTDASLASPWFEQTFNARSQTESLAGLIRLMHLSGSSK